MRALAALALAVAAGCGPKRGDIGEPFPAQSIWASPQRPALPADADTNDATAYYELGVAKLAFHPDTAAAAFYWATQLDPWRADAYYARAVALVRTLWRPSRYGIWIPRRRLRMNEVQLVDSLNHVAYELNPYIDRRFDDLIGPPTSYFICDRVLDAIAAAVCFMQSGNYRVSVQKVSEALKKDPKEISLHYLRAQAYYKLGRFDSAAIDLGVLADSLGGRQEKKLTALYVSRATIYYAQGMAYTQMDDTAAARAAYERALTEDLGFHMASVRLAGRALTSGDTTTALSHLAHAVSISPKDAALRLYYGILLAARKQREEARDQFLEAIEINPHFAQPYLHLAQTVESTDRGTAVASYETFILRSPRADPSRPVAAERLRKLVGPP